MILELPFLPRCFTMSIQHCYLIPPLMGALKKCTSGSGGKVDIFELTSCTNPVAWQSDMSRKLCSSMNSLIITNMTVLQCWFIGMLQEEQLSTLGGSSIKLAVKNVVNACMVHSLQCQFNWLGKLGWKKIGAECRQGFKDTHLLSVITGKIILSFFLYTKVSLSWLPFIANI